MRRKIKTNAIYFESEMNSQIERFEFIESSINFNQKTFANDCMEQMTDLCVEVIELSKACYISITRVHQILKVIGDPITDEEMKIIKKRLSLT